MARWSAWAWLLLAFFGGAGLAKERTAVCTIVTIRVIDQSALPGWVLWPATAKASRLFSATGVCLAWKGATGVSRQEALQANDEMQMLAESIELLIKSSSADEHKGALAFAAPFARTGVRITIFYDRIAALRSASAPAAETILACVLAHEIGHVFLRTNGHSESGLMRATGKSGDFGQMAHGLLAFTPVDAELIRRNVQVSRNRDCGVPRPGGRP